MSRRDTSLAARPLTRWGRLRSALAYRAFQVLLRVREVVRNTFATATSKRPGLSIRTFTTLIKNAATAGDTSRLEDLAGRQLPGGPHAQGVQGGIVRWGRAFAEYRITGDAGKAALRVMWWDTPPPGNFGDWLSPYIFSRVTGRRIEYVQPGLRHRGLHVVGLGSICKHAGPRSIVLGAGINDAHGPVDVRADYRLVRGPRTAMSIRRSGGKSPELFGDPGILMRRLFPLELRPQSGQVALVRHLAHRKLDLQLPENVEEVSINASLPSEVENFLLAMASKEYVITSALHCFIACQSLGIPCGLVTFAGAETAVYGDGTKYLDYLEGTGQPGRLPDILPTDLRKTDLANVISHERVADAILDDVERELSNAADPFDEVRASLG